MPSVSISCGSGSPCALAKAIASATAWMTPAHMIWFVALAAWPEPARSEVRDGAAHGLQHRLGALEGWPRSAHHDGERAVARTFDATADRRIEEFRAAGGQPPGGFPRGIGAHRGAVDDERAGPQARQQAHRRCSSTSASAATQSTMTSHSRASAAGLALRRDVELGCEFVRQRGRAVPDRAQQPGLVQVARHAAAHGAEAGESRFE